MAEPILKFQIANFARGKDVTAGSFSVTDVRELQTRLKAIEPMLRTQLVRDAKKAAEPTVSDIKSAIGRVTPNSGMVLPGARLNWNNAIDGKGRSHRAQEVKAEFRTSSSGRSNVSTLVRVRVANPAVMLADMGGRSGRYINAGYKGSGYTREYSWKGTKRKHRVNGQFTAVANKIGGSASRFVWPAAESSIPNVRNTIENILRNAYTRINSKGI